MSSQNSTDPHKAFGGHLERLYSLWNDPQFIHPDPLELVIPFQDVQDREIAALIASSLAYGRVKQILVSVSTILQIMENTPRRFLETKSHAQMTRAFRGFKHRFHTGNDIVCLLTGIRTVLEKYGTLQNSFLDCLTESDPVTVRSRFTEKLCCTFPDKKSTLLPDAKNGSACKRLNLMLRWLVRHDNVDPGGWDQVPASALIVPLDTHMHRIARTAGFTNRNSADFKTAVEITETFAQYAPDDPVRYDFVLTRFGINPDFPRFPEELS